MIKSGWSQLLAGLVLILAADAFVQRNVLAVLEGERALHHNDFRHLYVASCVLQQGGNFYDPQVLLAEAARQGVERLNPYVYPPFLAVALLPLSWVTFEQAGRIWYGINLACAGASCLLLAALAGSRRKLLSLALVTTLLATSEPLTRTLTAGQLNLLLLFLLALSLWAFQQKHPALGGAVLGLATAIKVFPALLILLLVWRRKLQAAGTALISVALVTSLAAGIAGFRVSLDYLDLLGQMGYGSSTWEQFGQRYHIDPANQSPAALLTRLFTVDPDMGLWGVAHRPNVARVASMLVALALVLTSFRATRPGPSIAQANRHGNRASPGKWTEADSLAYSLFVLLSLLLPSLMWDHYLTIALLPAVLYLRSLQPEQTTEAQIVWVATSIVLLHMTYHFWSPMFQQGWLIALASVKLPGALILFSLHLSLLFRTAKQPGHVTGALQEGTS